MGYLVYRAFLGLLVVFRDMMLERISGVSVFFGGLFILVDLMIYLFRGY